MNHKLTKEDWVDMFKQIGLTEDQMKKWHHIFENRHPEGHKAFLSWLGFLPKRSLRSGTTVNSIRVAAALAVATLLKK